MGNLYEMKLKVEKAIKTRGLDEFKTKGQIGLKCGFSVTMISDTSPDELEKIARLREAAKHVLQLAL